MKSVIVGTAGHIDHGKTALVKALTGIDADRLEEEKRRGITIDIGFAHLELPVPGGEMVRLGFVDVPGHERFVRNMLAGIGGIDLVLMVIAADESIKPQTREHFEICRLLAVRRGITVLTKSDLVDRATLSVAKMEVEEYLSGSFLGPPSPVIVVSSLTGAGIEDLKQALLNMAIENSVRDSSALSRLPVDRVFTMKGFGTVVTGTLIAGAIRKDEELEVFPSGRQVRVRGVQVHGQATTQALAGQRTALNLAGVAKEDLARGMMLSPPAMFRSASRVDVSLSLLASAKALKDRARVHLHAYTSETTATIRLHDRKEVSSGGGAFAQLRLRDPVLLLPGDRFIIRQFSPVATIGGGVVLDASPMLRKLPAEEVIAFLKKMQDGERETVLAARISRRRKPGLTTSDAVAETGWRMEQIALLLADLIGKGKIVGAGGVFLSVEDFHIACSETLAAVESFHQGNPLVSGIQREELRERVKLGPEVFTAVVDVLVRGKKLESVNELVRALGQGVVMKDEESESKQIIESTFSTAGLTVPALKDVLASLKVDKVRAQKIVTLLLRDKVLIKVSDDLVFHRQALDNLRKRMATEKEKSPRIDVGRFKELAGISRKYAIPLLEYLDREHVTRRVGDARLIL